MRKRFHCVACGAFTNQLWIDRICEACQSLRKLLYALDATVRLPEGDNFPVRVDLHAMITSRFQKLTERDGADTVRARLAGEVDAWAAWNYEKWLAEREGREAPPEPNVFQAVSEMRAKPSPRFRQHEPGAFDPDYADQKLYEAVFTLVVGQGALRSRLVAAAVPLCTLSAGHFPDNNTAMKWEAILDELTSKRARNCGEGRVHATVEQLSDQDASLIAERILQLYEDVRKSVQLVGQRRRVIRRMVERRFW
jgi:hypothetical protein